MALRNMQHDCARFEQREVAFFISRNAPERIERAMRGLLQFFHGKKTNVVGLAHFFERPANAHFARLPLALVGRLFEGGNGGESHIDLISISDGTGIGFGQRLTHATASSMDGSSQSQ